MALAEVRARSESRSKLTVRLQSAVILAALLVAVGLTFGPIVQAGAVAAFTAVWAWSMWAVRRRRLAIVGSELFCEEAARWAARSGRRVAGAWVVDGLDDVAADAYPPPHEELLVDGRVLEDLRTGAPDLLGQAEWVFVVARAWPVDAGVEDPLTYMDRCFKRILDLAVATIVLVVTAPVLLIAMAAIYLESGGPALFTHTRVGTRGHRFRLYKLRTMRPADPAADAAYLQAMTLGLVDPGEGGLFKPSASRITKVGRYLRRFSIDELPQLFNVLRGDMSIVGPRPPMAEEVDVYDDHLWQRLRVKPGLTGLSQVNGRSRNRIEEIVAMDLDYCDRWSPALELAILFRTPFAVLSGDGAG